MKRIRKAVAGLVLDSPFFASILLKQELKEDDTCETMYVDGKVLGFNPGFVETLSMDELKGVLAHESLHLTNAHHARRGNRDPKKWNIACDISINSILATAGFTLPKGALPGNELSAEANYAALPDNPDPQGSKGKADPGSCGEVRDAKNEHGQTASPAEMETIKQEAAIMTAQAYQQAKACGKVPCGMDKLVESLLYPVLDAHALLKRFLENTARNDYSWSYPNRRFIGQGLYLPSLKSQELPEIVIVVDTSGTIVQAPDALTHIATVISDILTTFQTHVTVLYCDTAIQGVETFDNHSLPIVLNAKGGGGTSFIPPFEYIDREGLNPKALIYLTDGLCHRFPEPPDFPVLWLLTEKPYVIFPFGEVITLQERKRK